MANHAADPRRRDFDSKKMISDDSLTRLAETTRLLEMETNRCASNFAILNGQRTIFIFTYTFT